MNRSRLVFIVLAALCALMGFSGCGPSSADAGADSEPGGHDAPSQETALSAWPIYEPTGRVRQVTKYVDAAQADPSLVLMSDLPGSQMPAWDIDPIGVERVSAAQVEALLDSGRWAVVDVRKDRDILDKGTIPGSYHLEYKHQGTQYTGETRLTRQRIDDLLQVYDGIILFCNGPKCPRSFNASVHVVQGLGVAGSRVRWFRKGVPSWTRSPLIPVANQLPTNPETSEN